MEPLRIDYGDIARRLGKNLWNDFPRLVLRVYGLGFLRLPDQSEFHIISCHGAPYKDSIFRARWKNWLSSARTSVSKTWDQECRPG